MTFPPKILRAALLLLSLLSIAMTNAIAAPIIPAITNSKISDEMKGLVLVEELNCAACHTADAALAGRSKKAPRLASIGSRANPDWIEEFIANPHGTKPGTTMPDLLGKLSTAEKKQTATEIAHFLFSQKKSDFAPQAPDAVASKHGQRLFHSRGCAACHSPRDENGVETLAENSVPLGALEKKYSFQSLVDFLRQPHSVRPSGRMPDMQLGSQDIERIAHFLLQNTKVPGALNYTLYSGQVWEGLASEKVTADRAGHVKDFALESLGKTQRHTAVRYDGWLNIANAGRYSFFLTMNGGSLLLDGKPIIEQEPSDRRGVKALQGAAELTAGKHAIQLVYIHTGRDAKFSCEMEGRQFPRGPIPSAMLSVSAEPIAPFTAPQINADFVARGRDYFTKLGCANCHDDLKLPTKVSTPFAKLAPNLGCLSETDNASPRFHLTAAQRVLVAKALPLAEKPQLDDAQQIAKTLVTFNCIACHERTGVGGIDPARNALFTGTQPALGDQGRIPPPLSNVGAKLQPGWIAEILLRGKRQRSYVDASMPQFGEANVGNLVGLFGKVDRLEEAVLPKVANIQESKAAGYEMIGTDGLSCIACHEFNGQKSGEMAALDIAHTTTRLQKNWFALYMRQPSRFHPTVIMPSFWPDGKSTRPNILAGDTPQQIEALWNYLSDGTRAKKPVGLSRQTNEIRVGDTTELCRGQSPIGYRGIAVGYPERISLAFDSGEMALRQLWKGEFASVDFARFSPRGTEMISFPPGIPFHRLAKLEDQWPYKAKTNYTFPQDHGYEFRGYVLDAARRPTFRYQYGDISVDDYFEDVGDSDGKAFFRRTLRFDAPAAQPSFYFRAAVGKNVASTNERTFSADKLELRITTNHKAIIREGETADVLIPVTLPKGKTTLTLEYRW